jgi:hypothetical protein
MTSTVPPGRRPLCIAIQALRTWLLSACRSGTKGIFPSKRLRIILALKGLTSWARRGGKPRLGRSLALPPEPALMNREMSGCFLSDRDIPSPLLLINGLWLSLARAPRSGRGGRGFESHQPDFFVQKVHGRVRKVHVDGGFLVTVRFCASSGLVAPRFLFAAQREA